MKVLISIVICKVLCLLGRLTGRFSSLPGKIVLKIFPDILKDIKLCENIIAITGSNGKTSTTELVATTLKKSGIDAVYNKKGSNQIEGVATLILSNCDLHGNFKRAALVIESDERYSQITFKYFTPKYYLITNILRDQMTRNRHPEWIADIIAKGISPNSKLILNADDPMAASLGINSKNAVYYRVNKNVLSQENSNTNTYNDYLFCPSCKMPLKYEYKNYGVFGKFICTNCGNGSKISQFVVTDINKEKCTIEINEKYSIKVNSLDIHNTYNLLAAFSVCACYGVKQDKLAQALSNHKTKTDRVIKFTVDDIKAELLISKHENSTSYNCSIAHALSASAENITVLIVVDRISRKYFTSETSWLWDIEFEKLNDRKVKKIILAGKYCYDLLTRFNCTEIPKNKISYEQNLDLLRKTVKKQAEGDLFILTCFSDKDRVLKALIY